MHISQDFPLADILWYKIGGTAKYLLDCQSKEDLEEALKFIKENNISKVFVCGQGSNLIFTDEYFDGAIIHLIKPTGNSIFINEHGQLEAFAGEVLGDVVKFSLDNNLVGLEWAGGLPGTLGAGVRGNVGAYGGEIKDNLITADVLEFGDGEPQLRTLTNQELQFEYRGSIVKTQKNMVVISATFQLEKGNPIQVLAAKEVYESRIQNRKDKHPLEYPNCGSVFKNLRDPEQIKKVLSVYPEFAESVEKKWYGKVAVASLIEKFGLKGYLVGDAQISEKHALFIVNLGHAKAADVLSIIDKVQATFQEKLGFGLEVEVEIVK